MFSKESTTRQSRRWPQAKTIVDSRSLRQNSKLCGGVEHQNLLSYFNVKLLVEILKMKDKSELTRHFVNCPGLQVSGGGREIRETLAVQVEKKEVDDDTKDQEEEEDEPKYLANCFDSTK